MNCGTYKIQLGSTTYVGQSKDLSRRRARHLGALRAGTHYNAHLQRAFNKYGEESFTFSIRMLCPAEDLNHNEQLLLDAYCGTPGNANRAKRADQPLAAYDFTDEHRAKLSASLTGRELSASHRAAIVAHRARHPRATVKNACKSLTVTWKDGSVESFGSQKDLGARLGVAERTAGRLVKNQRPATLEKYGISEIN